METIDELMKAKTIIIIAYRTKTTQSADQILVTDEGKAVQRGKYEQLKKEEGIYHRLVYQKEKTVSWKL